MKGIKIDFNATGAVLDLDSMVSGFDAVNQDTLVNLGTQRGSDVIDKNRGSSLEALTLKSSSVISLQASLHVANIVAAETSFYIFSSDDFNEPDKLANMELQPIALTPNGLKLNTVTVSISGQYRGISTTLI